MQPPRMLPPHYFVLSLAAMILIALVDSTTVLPARWNLLGVIGLIKGVALAAWGSRLFSRAGTNIVPFTQSTALVTEGIFSRSRNPMYLGMILALIGTALLLNAVWPWIVVVTFTVLLRVGFVKHEEVLMEQTFGDEYLDYKGRVRRWV